MPAEPDGPQRRRWPASRRILLALFTVYAAMGVMAGVMPARFADDRAVDLVLAMSLCVAVYAWCRAEGLERGVPAPGRSALWAALLTPVFLPVYFLRTRTAGAALRASAKAAAVYLLLIALLAGSAFVTESVLAAAG